MSAIESKCVYINTLGGCTRPVPPEKYAVEMHAVNGMTNACLLMNEQQNQRFCPGFKPTEETPTVEQHVETRIT